MRLAYPLPEIEITDRPLGTSPVLGIAHRVCCRSRYRRRSLAIPRLAFGTHREFCRPRGWRRSHGPNRVHFIR